MAVPALVLLPFLFSSLPRPSTRFLESDHRSRADRNWIPRGRRAKRRRAKRVRTATEGRALSSISFEERSDFEGDHVPVASDRTLPTRGWSSTGCPQPIVITG